MSNETVTYSLEAVLTRIESKIDSLEKRMDERFDKVDERFDKVEDRLTKVEIGQAELKAEQDIRVINEIELKVSRAIVSKIWTQLGSPTYEQLKGRSIYHLIDELKAELARERARMDYILRVCSAGVFYNATSRAAIDAP